MNEFQHKQQRLRALLSEWNLDGLLLRRASSFAWATCGADPVVNRASTTGTASLLITQEGSHLLTDNIEAPRLIQEEGLDQQGWIIHAPPWYQAEEHLQTLTRGMRLGADTVYPDAIDLSVPLARLRSRLTLPEVARFRRLGQLCAEAMDQAIRAVRPGQTEHQIAALLSQAAEERGVQAIVLLVATDQRVFDFRHPLPTAQELDDYAMLVLCGRKWGLVCSITRLLHFGPLSSELRHKMEAVAQVDATFIHHTRPGATLDQVFQKAVDAYAATGYANEWQLHHQGGVAGYEPREFIATPSLQEEVVAPQAYAWNPSITGVKSEDTVLVGENGVEVLTEMPGWPTIPVTVDGVLYERPAVLERE